MPYKEDPQIQAVLRHQNAKALHSIPKEAEDYLTEAGTKDLITNDLPKSATWKAKKLKLKYKEDITGEGQVEGESHAGTPQVPGEILC